MTNEEAVVKQSKETQIKRNRVRTYSMMSCLMHLWRRISGEEIIKDNQLNNEDGRHKQQKLFMLYFKCSISDETVMNAKMSLGGIGVAIYDPERNRCVFEMRKPVGEQGVNDEHQRHVVELESFLESLNAAVTLGITQINILSNSYPVYQYYTGSLKASRNKNIATLVRQLNLIRRKFTSFSSALVGQDHLRFANKLTRDAISAQVTNFIESTNYIKTSSVTQDKVYCPFLKCSALMSRTKLQELGTISSKEPGMRKCVECDRVFCINCQVPWHTDVTCSVFSNYLSHKYFIDPKLKALAVGNNLLHCENCNNTIERAAGCYYISCRSCVYEFCYKCRAERIQSTPTSCRCPIQDDRR